MVSPSVSSTLTLALGGTQVYDHICITPTRLALGLAMWILCVCVSSELLVLLNQVEKETKNPTVPHSHELYPPAMSKLDEHFNVMNERTILISHIDFVQLLVLVKFFFYCKRWCLKDNKNLIPSPLQLFYVWWINYSHIVTLYHRTIHKWLNVQYWNTIMYTIV